jgi:von Willebrand factor type A domain
MSTAGTEVARPGTQAPPAPPAPPPLTTADTAMDPSHPPAAPHPVIPMPTQSEWKAAGVSLFFHLMLLLILAALLLPVSSIPNGTSIDGGLGNEAGDGDLLDSVTIGSPDPGTAHDIEKSLTPAVDGGTAVEGAMAGGSGSGSGSGKGSIDAIASLGAAGGGGKGVGFFGTRARAESVVFVVDMSGSMEGHRFDRAVTELSHSLGLLQPTQKFFIFFYNGATYPMFDQRNAKLLPATSGNKAKATKWIKGFHAEGDTAPEEALEKAIKMKPQVIYFLTDGEIPNTTRSTCERVNKEHKVVIHTIAFEYEGGAEQLRGIAADSKGKYRFVQ